MFDNDYFSNLLNGLSSTTTEEKTDSETETYGPQTNYSVNNQTTYSPSYEKDDYSSAQSFTEEQSYHNPTMSSFEPISEHNTVSQMEVPMIQKSEPTVNLVKSRSKIYFETRMKIVLSVFAVIVACLLFVSIYNFAEAGRIRASFADKEIQIKNLRESISNSKVTYTLVSDDEYIREWAETNNYVDKTETNSFVIDLDEMIEEETITEIPSNWFNDVCEFFSKLFAWILSQTTQKMFVVFEV